MLINAHYFLSHPACLVSSTHRPPFFLTLIARLPGHQSQYSLNIVMIKLIYIMSMHGIEANSIDYPTKPAKSRVALQRQFHATGGGRSTIFRSNPR